MKKKILIMLLVGLTCMLGATGVQAAPHATSANVAVVPSYTGAGTAGYFDPTLFPAFAFTQLNPSSVTSRADLTAYDTIVLWEFCYPQSYPAFTSALIDWMKQDGGKLLIWDSDSCNTEDGTAAAYSSWLNAVGAEFQLSTPGQLGCFGGALTIVDENKLNTSNSISPYYIDTNTMISSTDAVGDENVVDVATVSPIWCADMKGTNCQGGSGYVVMYTKAGAMTGAPEAWILYSGIDTDYINGGSGNPGSVIMVKMMQQQLAHGWGPAGSPEMADLGCVAISSAELTLAPAAAFNYLGTSHTVTATLTCQEQSGSKTPVQGETVNFEIISGPNQGLTGSGVTNANGQATFTYSSSKIGIDTIVATATTTCGSNTNTVTVTSNTVTKEWQNQPFCGWARVMRIKLCPSDCDTDVPPACKVVLDFTCTNCTNVEEFPITVETCGTEINLALLKAFNEKEPIDVCVIGTPDPNSGSHWTFELVDCITYPSSNAPQPSTSTTTTLPPTTTTSANSTQSSTTTSQGGSGRGGGSGSGGAKTTTTTVTSTSVPVTTTPITTSIPNPPPSCVTDAKCDDGIFCNGKETCSNGACVGGQPPCGAEQLCKENLKQCWDVMTITATSLNKSIWRPLIRERKCLWIVAKVAEDNHYTADASSIAAVGSISGAQGVSIDSRRKTLALLKGKLFLIPVCVERGATVGQWNIVIKTDIGSVPAEENIVTSFQVK